MGLDGFKHARSFADNPCVRGLLKSAENNGRGAFAGFLAVVQRDFYRASVPISIRDEFRDFAGGDKFSLNLCGRLE